MVEHYYPYDGTKLERIRQKISDGIKLTLSETKFIKRLKKDFGV